MNLPSDPPSPTTAADILRTVQLKLTRIEVGGCSCNTKAPDLKYHMRECHYRLAHEASVLLEAFKLMKDA